MPEAREESNFAPYDVITLFERRHAEGNAIVDPDHACAGFDGG